MADIIPLKRVHIGGGQHILVGCRVNGKQELGIVDTGANVTILLCAAHSPKLNAGTLDVSIGDRSFEFPRFNSMTNQHIERAYASADIPLPAIVIGMDILSNAVIDLKAGTLTLD